MTDITNPDVVEHAVKAPNRIEDDYKISLTVLALKEIVEIAMWHASEGHKVVLTVWGNNCFSRPYEHSFYVNIEATDRTDYPLDLMECQDPQDIPPEMRGV